VKAAWAKVPCWQAGRPQSPGCCPAAGPEAR
jgi:hypothetical protein